MKKAEREARDAWWVGVEIQCPGCGEPFIRKYAEQKYHSQPCAVRAYNRANADGHANRGAKKGGATRREQLLGVAQPGTYKKADGGHVHRQVAARVLGRALHPREVVHHEDLDKHNNEPENLFVFVSQAQHARHHKNGHVGLPTCDCYVIRLREVI